nr:MAG TPA: hypothetical protein [Caudoviricetes sp.]
MTLIDLSSLTKQIVPFMIEGLFKLAALATNACLTLSARIHRPPYVFN